MKVASVVMSVTVAMSTLGLGGTTATAAGLPTTDGHDKYVDKAVFDVIEVILLEQKNWKAHCLTRQKEAAILPIYKFQCWRMMTQV